ncbi:hypothetical protein ARMGADRAFT_1069529 [Armillaria gallica]|uniref:Uncharacterized protein n=1 Tax=Armillaria gallica TaxID=47427 RepID=A0A2H3CQY1_ARMGA|nr:hypothetical protein ARMGADRAFT_1069529 [Armillaria gallica]
MEGNGAGRTLQSIPIPLCDPLVCLQISNAWGQTMTTRRRQRRLRDAYCLVPTYLPSFYPACSHLSASGQYYKSISRITTHTALSTSKTTLTIWVTASPSLPTRMTLHVDCALKLILGLSFRLSESIRLRVKSNKRAVHALMLFYRLRDITEITYKSPGGPRNDTWMQGSHWMREYISRKAEK